MSGVVVTGMGIVTAAGAGLAPLASALERGETLLRIHGGEPWPTARVDDASLAWPGDPLWIDLRKYASRSTQLAVSAGLQAIDEARLAGPAAAERCGTVVVVEPDTGGWEEMARIIVKDDPRPPALRMFEDLPDFHILRAIPTLCAQMVSLLCSFEGPATSVCHPALGGLAGLSLATRLLESGSLDAVMLVGCDTVPSPVVQTAMDRVERLGNAAVAGRGPFDLLREGTFVGEGAAALLLEHEDHAAARGARARARIMGCETRCGASAGRALAGALDALRLAEGSLPDVVFSHGSASPEGDRLEASALGGRVRAPVTATKGVTGRLASTSALVDLIVALYCLREAVVPPIGLLRNPDPALAFLDLVVGAPKKLDMARRALVCALDEQPWGGGGATLVEIVSGCGR